MTNEQIEKIADALIVELRRQGEEYEGPYLFNISDDLTRVGVDGYVNLQAMVKVVIDRWEDMPHEPKWGV